MRAAEAPVHLRRLRGPGPLATLISLFLLLREADAEDAASALPLAEAEAEGVLEREGGTVRPLVQITPVGDLLLVHDREDSAFDRRDHVAGVGPATRTLASLTVRDPVRTALDLGTGCGIQALLASRHAERVVAVDVNSRALRFARLSARLSGVANVEWREGSFYEPVRGDRFDLVVANPPFVLSFDSEFVFRDAGEAGDAISRDAVRGAAAHLADGGHATILCSWVHERDGDWQAPPRRWVAGTACDAWLLRYRSDDALTYAAGWNRPLQARDPEAFAAALDRWLAQYQERGVEAMATGAVILRRSDSDPLVRADEMPLGPSGSASEQILRVFAAQSRLAELGDADLLELVPALTEGHRLEQALSYRDNAYVAEPARLVPEEGTGVVSEIAPQALHVLLLIDGRRPLARLVADVVEQTGFDARGVESAALAAVRSLLGLGLLVLERS